MEVEWSRLKARELQALASRDAIVLIPIGATEQHGPHLPVQVDARLATEVSLRAARHIEDSAPVVVAPTVWCGISEHHMDLGGTISLDFATMAAVVGCICRSVARHGFQRLFIVNGHGGNTAALQVIAGELTVELGRTVGCCTYWLLDDSAAAEILDKQKNVQHAGEAETSMMLALTPELIDAETLSQMHGPMVHNASGIEGVPKGAYRWRRISSRSPNGVIGDAGSATPDKGERLLDAYATRLAEVLANPDYWSAAT